MQYKCPVIDIRGTHITYEASYDRCMEGFEKTYMLTCAECTALYDLFEEDDFNHLTLKIVITISDHPAAQGPPRYDPTVDFDKVLCVIDGEFDPLVLKLTSGVQAL